MLVFSQAYQKTPWKGDQASEKRVCSSWWLVLLSKMHRSRSVERTQNQLLLQGEEPRQGRLTGTNQEVLYPPSASWKSPLWPLQGLKGEELAEGEQFAESQPQSVPPSQALKGGVGAEKQHLMSNIIVTKEMHIYVK